MKTALVYSTFREGYRIDQIRSTMTVGDLICFLEQFDDEMPVYMDFDNGYTYGSFDEHRFEETDIGEEEDF